MAFQPGQSGNPSGRPKKLLKRVDEVLSERGIDPVAEVLRILDALKRRKVTGKTPEERAKKKAALEDTRLRIWLEIWPYVYARPREAVAEGDPPDETAKRRLAGLSDAQLLQLVKNQTG